MISECYEKNQKSVYEKLKVEKAWNKNCLYHMVIITLQIIKDQDLKETTRNGIICLDGKLWVDLFFLVEV